MLIAIRILQVIAAIFGLFTFANGAQFGARVYGAESVDWSQILYAIVPGIGSVVSWAASHWLGLRVTTPAATELISAIAAWLPGLIAKKEDVVARRRVVVALFSLIDSINGWDELEKTKVALGAPITQDAKL